MATTDEDLQKKRKHVEDLRQKVADTNAKREQGERELNNDILAAQLDIEAVQLEKELVEAKRIAGFNLKDAIPEVPKLEPVKEPSDSPTVVASTTTAK